MEMTEIKGDIPCPAPIKKYFQGRIFDSSCSKEARVYYSEGQGLFIKTAPEETLLKECVLTDYMHKKGFAPEVVDYVTDGGRDWAVTRRLAGFDLTKEKYLSRPEWLAERLGEVLSMLHSLSYSDCPIQNRLEGYIECAREGYAARRFDPSYSRIPLTSMDGAYRLVEENARYLERNALIHGDPCLPNILFVGDVLSGFIDLGGCGVADRHIDLFWAEWTLEFNLGTGAYRDRLFDAYGRNNINEDIIDIISVFECFG